MMIIPEPLPCLADACPSPLACNARGQCKARERDTWASWWQAFAACRKRGIADPFREPEADAEPVGMEAAA